MRLKDDQILRLAEKIFNDLSVAELITLKKDRGAVLTAMREAIAADLRVEQTLERDAEALLEQTLKSVGGGQEIDRHKMLQMIKVKLAKDRKIVL